MWRGELVRESTHQTNDKIARQMEAAQRTSLAKGEVGIRERKPAPTLSEFCKTRFEPWAQASFEKSTPANWLWYRAGIRPLLSYKPLANAKLDSIGKELAADFAAFRQADAKQISTINSALRVLRRILRLSVEWGVLEACPVLSLLPGERHRETVVTPEQEQKYLEHSPEPLKSIATVLADSGMRSEECYRMRWENVNWEHGRNGAMLVTHGKTAAARGSIPMTLRARFLLEARWEFAGKPAYGWVWPAPTQCGHVNHASLRKQHARAFREANAEIKAKAEKAKPALLRPWVLYSFRHTFLTRLGESGCDAWTLARIAGHGSIAISSRYVHPSEDAVLNAMAKLGGHKIERNAETKENCSCRGIAAT